MGKYSRLYTTRQWRNLRARKLQADPLCWYCDQIGKLTLADTVDHIIAHNGDMDRFLDWDNLRSCCRSCHDSAAQMKDKHGFVPGVGVDGLPIDCDHPWLAKDPKD